MTLLATPAYEEQRLDALKSLNILDSPGEDRYDRITRIAARALNVPITTISFVDAERIWFKSAVGLQAREVPREDSLCDHALTNQGLTEIPDVASDPRFANNLMVSDAPKVGFYASYPVNTPGGRQVGGICLIDSKPRQMTDEDREFLRDFACLVEDELTMDVLSATQSNLLSDLDTARRQVLVDSLTQVWNRAGILEILNREHARAKRDGTCIGLALADLDNFKQVNDRHGHLAGDTVLRVAADRMNEAIRPYDALGRYGGEEFLIVIVEKDENEVTAIAERVRKHISSQPVSVNKRAINVSASLGIVCGDAAAKLDTVGLIQAADDALYRAKRAGRNQVEVYKATPFQRDQEPH